MQVQNLYLDPTLQTLYSFTCYRYPLTLSRTQTVYNHFATENYYYSDQNKSLYLVYNL